MKIKSLLMGITAISTISTAQTYNQNHYPAVTVVKYDSKPYLGLAYGITEVNDDYLFDGVDEITEIDYDTLMVQLGYEFFPFFSLEGRYWKSASSGDYTLYTNAETPEAGSYENFSSLAVYAKPIFPVSKYLSFYALLGLANTEVDGKSQWNSSLLDDLDFSWGVGVEVNLNDNLSLFLDWVDIYDDTHEDYYSYYPTYPPQLTSVDSLNFGMTFKF